MRKASYGLMTYFFIRLCIPTSTRLYDLSFNTCCFTLLLVLTLYRVIVNYIGLSREAKSIFKVYGILFAVLFLLCFAAHVVPLPFQLTHLVQFTYTEIIPAVYVVILIRSKRDFIEINKVILAAGVFSACYGIYTFLLKSNPLFTYFGADNMDIKDYSESMRFGITGRAVGIYNDKIFLSLVSLLLLIYYTGKSFLNKTILYVFLLLTMADMLLTLQRSSLLAVVLFVIVLFSGGRYRKYVIRSLVLCVICVGVLFLPFHQLDGIRDMFVSSVFLWDDNLQSSMGVGGSSFAMRVAQLTNVIAYLKGQYLCGMGYSFTEYYYTIIFNRELYGMDTSFYGFESFVFKILIASGLIGLIAWGWTFYRLFRYMQGNLKISENRYFLAFFLSYVLAITITDTSGSTFLFFTFVSLNMMYRKYFIEERK